MSDKTCPHCNKPVQHRKMCPVLRKEKQKQDEILYKQRLAEEKIEKEKLNSDLESLKIKYPRVINYIKSLEDEISCLQGQVESLEMDIRFANLNSYESDY